MTLSRRTRSESHPSGVEVFREPSFDYGHRRWRALEKVQRAQHNSQLVPSAARLLRL